jgi:hypothetical protein
MDEFDELVEDDLWAEVADDDWESAYVAAVTKPARRWAPGVRRAVDWWFIPDAAWIKTVHRLARELDPDVPAMDRIEIVVGAKRRRDTLDGQCSDPARGKYEVRIWASTADDPLDIAETVAHELRHAAQAERGATDDVPRREDDFDAYYAHPLEVDARAFAARVIGELQPDEMQGVTP